MFDLTVISSELAWPISLLIAWFAGEYGYRWAKIPRISSYAIVGFLLASSQAGLLPIGQSTSVLLLSNVAFGLILFEAGYRINLRWLSHNPWIGVTCLTEATLTFAAVYAISRGFGVASTNALLLASLSMATSPAAIVRVINEQRSAGQVSERLLHLSALNCVLAVFVFKIVVGLLVFETTGSLWHAASSSLLVLAASALLGGCLGLIMPILLRGIKCRNQDNTLAFVIALVLLVALSESLKLSAVLATLTFGLMVRHRRLEFHPLQRGFGALGDLLSVLLFVFIASTLQWQHVISGMGLGLAIIATRMLTKVCGISIFARISGITWRKGMLLGVAMTPMSAFVILMLEQTRHLGIHLADQLIPLASAALILEVFGPIITKQALIWSHEVPKNKE
ncbi:cation:proton antiporter [Iodobacter arcticus]|uniref:Cation:proton antiporter n=1 Tax=Iodobacter arcticus TaxID=590593 RepID=A0ABW2R254_9NEIS